MTSFVRLSGAAFLTLCAAFPAAADAFAPALSPLAMPASVPVLMPEIAPVPLPDPVRAMIAAAIGGGKKSEVETVVTLARATNPRSAAEIDAIFANWEARRQGIEDPDPVRQMLAVAMASKKDGDVEAVGKLAKKATPDKAEEIDAQLAQYRAKRAEEKAAAAAAERERLARAKIWENWKGEGQVGASMSSGNTDSKGLSLGVALTRKGLDWNNRVMGQADYQRSNGKTTVEKFIAEYEPQYRLSDRAFAYGLGRWERDRMQGFDARWNLSGGLGYKVVDGKAMTLNLKAGPTWRRTNFIDEPADSEISGLAGLDFGWQLSPSLKLTQTASTIVGESTTSTSSLTALNAKLSGALTARIAYSAAYDTHPAPGVEKLDTLTRFTLVYGF